MTENNRIRLHGTAKADPERSHSAGDTEFYSVLLEVPRLSGTPDEIPLLLRERDLRGLRAGTELSAEGEIRTWNNRSGTGRRLVMNVLVDSWEEGPGEPANEAELSCVLCRDPVLRRTPLGRTICDLTSAVRRPSGRSDYLPMIAWGSVAASLSELACGDSFRCRARFQSRAYSKALPDGTVEERTAYEISVMSLADGASDQEPEPDAPEDGA